MVFFLEYHHPSKHSSPRGAQIAIRLCWEEEQNSPSPKQGHAKKAGTTTLSALWFLRLRPRAQMEPLRPHMWDTRCRLSESVFFSSWCFKILKKRTYTPCGLALGMLWGLTGLGDFGMRDLEMAASVRKVV